MECRPARAARQVGNWLVEAVYVRTCAACDRRGEWVCRFCAAEIAPLSQAGCLRCGRDNTSICDCAMLPAEVERMRSVYPFAGWVREAIHRLKYAGERARAPMLADQVTHIVDQLEDMEGIIPVPIHPNRLRARGFNQSELLAKRISQTYGIPVMRVLERVEDRGSQVGRNSYDRWTAVEGAFRCTSPISVRNRRVIVLDDVITTGATISSCAVTLGAAGASAVRGISIARG
jgi:ComF family protein